ncbi:MAG: hypothetical protein V3W51_04595 [Candidatus Brocadiales bacterium]
MTIERIESDFRVVAYPTEPGDFGFASISGIAWKPGEERRAAEELLTEAKRHLYGARGVSNYISLLWKTIYRCSACGFEGKTLADVEGCCDATLPS